MPSAGAAPPRSPLQPKASAAKETSRSATAARRVFAGMLKRVSLLFFLELSK
jgi:hypothetical protein